MPQTDAAEPLDPEYRRMYYVRYADDFLVGINGSKTDAEAMKRWLGDYLSSEHHLELSQEKTLVTSAQKRVRFLGYEIKRWSGNRILRYPTTQGVKTRRTGTYQLSLLMPPDKTIAFAREYGNPNTWHGKPRSKLLNLSELEILLTYNAEVRGFLGYYSLADNLKDGAGGVLWITARSFFCTLANKRKSSVKKAMKSLKKGPARYVISLEKEGKGIKEYELITSTKQLKRKKHTNRQVDLSPKTRMYQSRKELSRRQLACQCECCGIRAMQLKAERIRQPG